MNTLAETRDRDLARRGRSSLATPTDLAPEAVRDIAAALNGILADVFALAVKTKNFHWHMSGPFEATRHGDSAGR